MHRCQKVNSQLSEFYYLSCSNIMSSDIATNHKKSRDTLRISGFGKLSFSSHSGFFSLIEVRKIITWKLESTPSCFPFKVSSKYSRKALALCKRVCLLCVQQYISPPFISRSVPPPHCDSSNGFDTLMNNRWTKHCRLQPILEKHGRAGSVCV